MKKLYPILIVLVNIMIMTAKNATCQDVVYSGTIPWQGEIVKSTENNRIKLYFNNAVYHDSLHILPIFMETVKVSFPIDQPYSAEIIQSTYETLPDSLLPVTFPGTRLQDSIQIQFTSGKERKRNCILFSLIPLRRNNQNGRIERLLNFSVRFHSSGNIQMPKMTFTSVPVADQSVLASGTWYKCSVAKSGVYKLTYAQLKSLGLSKPEDVRIYGHGGQALEEVNSGNSPDDLQEIPILPEFGADGVFNEGDDILFYAEGPVTWNFDAQTQKYTHQVHPFTDAIIYFITEKSGGKRITTATVPAINASIQVTAFDGLDYYEKNTYNLIRSGRIWLSDRFATQNSYSYAFTFPGLITTEPMLLESEVYSRSSTNADFQFTYNNQQINISDLAPVDVSNTTADFATKNSISSSFQPNNSSFSLTLNYFNNGNTDAVGYLDYIRLRCRQSLIYSTSQLLFRDSRSVGSGNIALFTISGATPGLQIWDITDVHNVQKTQGVYQNNSFAFKAGADNLKTYVAFDPQNIIASPVLLTDPGKIPNQNLHGLPIRPLIIVTHPDFITQAQKLADLHLKYDNMPSNIVTTDQVYNEFSSGIPDPAAIRNFVKMFYDRAGNGADIPRYLLLLGDGSYDNKSTSFSNGSQNSNFIVTYQSANSVSQTDSYVSDDYFGMLDDNEHIENGMLDIGVGRLPVRNAASSGGVDEAANVVAKIERYMNKNNLGDWHNSICFIGDAGDNNTHVGQADQLASTVTSNFPDFNIKKIYVDAYPLVSTSSGARCPQANTAIADYLNKGLLVMNYTGHGSENGLSKEQIMRKNEDILVWKNNNLPLFMTATCELSRYDDYEQTTGGEDILLNPDGGGIALLTTTRLVYSEQNYDLNTQFYKYAFVLSEDNPAFKLGDILRLTKNATSADVNKLNFTLLGDPALSLALPKYTIVTDSINHLAVSNSDTLKAYGNVSLIGHIADNSGILLSNYNGTIFPVIYDKVKNVNTLGNFDGGVFSFQLQDNVLFKGKATVKNGKFSINFVMPRDIDYNFGTGKISYYVSDSTTDGAGYFNKVIIGGLESSVITSDTTGPSVRLFMNDTTFIDGGITDAYPTFLAKVSDVNGLNPGGNSIGHDIMAVMDNDAKSSITLNNYYETEIDNYKKGTVAYKFTNLDPGKHKIDFKIWDIFNNSIQASINFTVVISPSIQNVYNFPNPVSESTTFYFEHNISGESLEADIEIFNVSGTKICTLTRYITPSGYTSGPMEWDATDNNGNKINRGIYFYRIKLRYQSQEIISKTQKMIIIY